jgi:hypothetical protein
MTLMHQIYNQHLLSACPPDVDLTEWTEFRTMMAQASNLEELDHPLQIDVELNAGCNMACPFCIHGYEKIANNKLDRNGSNNQNDMDENKYYDNNTYCNNKAMDFDKTQFLYSFSDSLSLIVREHLVNLHQK